MVKEVLLGEEPPAFLAKSAVEDDSYFITEAALEVLLRISCKISLGLIRLPLVYYKLIGPFFYLVVPYSWAGP